MSPARVMVNTAAVLFVLALAWLLIQIHSIIILLILGILLAAAIEPLVYHLRRRGVSRGQSILAVYLAIAAVLGITLYLVVPPLVRQATALIAGIPDILGNLQAQASQSDNDFVRTTGTRTMARAMAAYNQLRTSPSIEGSTAFGLVTSIAGSVFTIVSVMIVAFYWMTEKALIKRAVLGLVPLGRRDRAHALWDEIEAKLGGWTRGQLTLCAVIGGCSAIGYFALGLKFWLAIAIWAGVTEIIPFIGPFLGGGVAVIVALTQSWQKAVLVAVFAFLLQQLEGAVLVPRVMRNSVGMTPLTVILAVFVGGTLLGPLGSVLAIPIGAAIQVLVQDLLRDRSTDADTGEAGEMVAATLTGQRVPSIDGASLAGHAASAVTPTAPDRTASRH